jgi:hypothetical protein
VGLIATDKSAQVFASVVPFPKRTTDGGRNLEAALVTPNAEAMMLSVTGLKPGIALDIEMNSEGEAASLDQDRCKRAYEWVVLPF